MKLKPSPNCLLCNTIQDSEHIFTNCENAVMAREAIDEFEDKLLNPVTRLNVLSLVKRILFLGKDKPMHISNFRVAIENRIDDLNRIELKKYLKKKRYIIIKQTLV